MAATTPSTIDTAGKSAARGSLLPMLEEYPQTPSDPPVDVSEQSLNDRLVRLEAHLSEKVQEVRHLQLYANELATRINRLISDELGL